MLSLIEGEQNSVAVLANVSALLNDTLDDLNWVGFYLTQGDELVLGPFQGRVACYRIPIGRGVCGSAALSKETQCIGDVHAFPGHIACDSASNAELVVPLIINDNVYGVLDIDSPSLNRFDQHDAKGIELIAENLSSYLATACQLSAN